MTVLLTIYAIIFVAALYLGVIRNTQVYNYQRKLINGVSEASMDDIRAGKFNWIERYRAYEKDADSYFVQVLKFWKPVSSFYPDTWYTDPNRTGPAV